MKKLEETYSPYAILKLEERMSKSIAYGFDEISKSKW